MLVLCLGGTMLAPLGVALYYGDGSAGALVKSIIATLAAGTFLVFAFKPTERISVSHREGMAVVTLAWASAGLFGALPFILGGVFEGLTDSVFEALSGFTTTGASVLTDIEVVPKGLLFWRSLTHWLGGMGIIVLSVAILPFLGVGGMELYKAEVPSPVVDRLRPRVTETARTLWKVYVLISALEVVFLWLGGMGLFESVCHTFGTLATGGFSTRNGSIGAFGAYHQYVIIVFMFLAGINFSLHYRALQGRPRSYFKDPELRFFFGILLIFALLVVVNLVWSRTFESFEESLRHGLFQVVSIITTTGASVLTDIEVVPKGLLFWRSLTHW
ncbi:MAG: TrkH family potassium uptake protein, partial [Deltaproteobacteria bacterium]|nr:TrkH family potassium uptake protein [Deltaproteobacteria bacterium]